MVHKNDYTVIVFLSNGETKKWTYVHKLDGFVDFLNKEHSGWSYMNVYDRRNRKYLKRFCKGNLVPDFL